MVLAISNGCRGPSVEMMPLRHASDFAMEFPKHESEVVSGQCWLSVEGVPEAVRLTAGDCFLLPRGLSSCLASDLSLTPVDASTIFPVPLNGGVASCNGGGHCLLVGGHLVLTG